MLTMKSIPFLLLSLAPLASIAAPNVAPTVTVSSAAMRPGTTLMDITYRVTDPDDATVKVRALAFVDGTRSFSKVIRPVTWAEGTEAKLGDAIPTGVDHTLTWDVAADWSIDLGNIKVEILARDGRGLLPFDWITIPAAGGKPELIISSNVPSSSAVTDALFWLYADSDSQLTLTQGVLMGTALSGIFNGENLGYTDAGTSFLYMRMNLSRATFHEKDLAISARSGLSDRFALHAVQRPWNADTLGVDPAATATEVMSGRWIKHTYPDGSITMSDRFNGLMWVHNAEMSGALFGYDAQSYCANLVYAGYDDWFLPDISRLSFMHSQKSFFVAGKFYWSSTPNLYYIKPDGSVLHAVPSSSRFYAWPVRGGQ